MEAMVMSSSDLRMNTLAYCYGCGLWTQTHPGVNLTATSRRTTSSKCPSLLSAFCASYEMKRKGGASTTRLPKAPMRWKKKNSYPGILTCGWHSMGFSCGSAGKESVCNAGDLGLIPGLGRSPGEGKGYSFQYSGLENSMDCIIHGVAKSWTEQLSLSYPFHGWGKLKLTAVT